MAHRTWTAVVSASAGAALLAGLLAPGTALASTSAVAPAAQTAAAARTLDGGPVTRLIVRMADRGPVPDGVVAAAARGAGVERAEAARRLAGGAQLVLLSAPVTAERARGLARALAARPDVAWAEPDVLLRPSDASPLTPDDPLFPEQWALWDQAADAVGGGYGSRAPAAWERTTGSRDVVVAVVDTGITPHPDLDPNVVPGYDFVSLDDVAPFSGTNLQPLRAGDGDGRDADPRDPGTWITEREATSLGFFSDNGCGATSSSWHGTHVAGIVAAAQEDGTGISGAAPGVRIQPLRAVGKCGGYLSDIADAIRWAAGGTGTGLPAANPTPADVINLSLGGAEPCAADGYLQSAITAAIEAGSVVVAAAGNDGALASTSTPAGCEGVITVGASNRGGDLAAYSNFGPTVDLLAPGGEGADGVLSTVNQGTTRPTQPGWAELSGTSMATPYVAAAAALLQSTRAGRTPYTPLQIRSLLGQLTRAPLSPGRCDVADLCGDGILDLSKPLPAAPPRPVPGGTADPQSDGVQLTWQATPDSGTLAPAEYIVTVTPDGGTAYDLPATPDTSSLVGGLTNGTAYSFSVRAVNDAELESTSTELGAATPVADAEALPSRPTDVVATPRTVALGVTWTASAVPGGASAVASYDIQYRKAGTDTWTTTTSTTTALELDPLPGGTYELAVRARNAADGTGPWSDVVTAVVPQRSTTVTVSGGEVHPFADGFRDSVTVTLRTNLDSPVTYQVLPPGGGAPIVSEELAGAGPWVRTFDGRDGSGDRLPRGTYTLQVTQLNPFHGEVEVTSRRTVVVRSSQVATPEVQLSSPTVYWYDDDYLDTMRITVPTNVPARQSWRLTNSTGTFTYRTWSFARSMSATADWTGWGTSSRLRSGTYYLRVTAQGGEGTSRTTVVKVSVSSQRLKKEWFSRTVSPGSVTIRQLNPAAGAPVLRDASFDGFTRKVLRVYGGYSDATQSGTYDVLSLSAALPSSVIRHTGVRVETCLRAPKSGWLGPPGTNLLGSGYMSSSTRFAGWFAGLLDEGSGEFTLEQGFIACLRPNLTTPSVAMAGGRIRWSLFNWAPSDEAYVPVYGFTISGYRYTLV